MRNLFPTFPETMRIRFYIHHRETESGLRLIFADYRHSTRWRFSTGVAVHQKHWNKKKQRVKTGFPQAQNINAVLDSIESRILEIAYGLQARKRSPLPEAVKAEYESGPAKSRGFWESWENFESEYVLALSEQTRKNYRASSRSWEAFEMEIERELSFDIMTESTFTRFRSWLRAKGRKENTIAGRIKHLKTFLGWVDRNGIADLPSGWDATKVGYRKKSERVTLSDTELQTFSGVDFEPRLQRVVDLFLFQSETGLRYSDAQTIRAENISGNVLTFRNVKSGKDQKRKLSPVAVNICAKYGGELPVISNQKFNKYIKEAAKIAGLSRSVLYQGKMTPLHDVITTHTARHTFATRLLRAGIPINTVSRMLGHSSVNTTSIYDQTGIEEEFEAIDQAL